ncbi:hypothetical protein HC256_004310 [Beauveria bassiana]|nr:hypothetical protein HC256_006679 [Beauveria bassiana]KAH8715431.1 hypothetical protein HC256_004250 [Beauveria bassiana]KAH8715493.1 hypothetical protein HC256_004310 [Beauveria bassiana]
MASGIQKQLNTNKAQSKLLSPLKASGTAIMWHRFGYEVTTTTSGENRPEAGPTTVEARLEKLMQENGHLRRQVNYFEGLLRAENEAMPQILHLSEGLRAVVSEFNGHLESFNKQWKSDERLQGGVSQPPMRAAAPEA